jgi:translation elongation factor EF-Tu-like GTPase
MSTIAPVAMERTTIRDREGGRTIGAGRVSDVVK